MYHLIHYDDKINTDSFELILDDWYYDLICKFIDKSYYLTYYWSYYQNCY